MGWNTGARTIKGVTYYNGTPFILYGNVPYYRNCDSTTPTGYRNSVTAYYYGHYSADYSNHPYGVAFKDSRQGAVDYFVDESAFPPATYYVYYNLNGGSGNFPTQSKIYNGSVNIHNRQPTRAGHTFKGWGTSSTTTTPSYYANSAYTGNASITLYAIWEANTYAISYDANGGAGAPNTQTYNYAATGDTYLSDAIPVREGYTFMYWNIEPDGSGLYNYNPGQAWGLNNAYSSTLYAIWEINVYRITAYANGGSIEGSGVFSTVGEYDTVISIPNPVRTGYTFAGWAVTGKGLVYKNGDSYMCRINAGEVTLVAQWQVNEYTITFDANTNGGYPSKIVDYNYGDVVGDNTAAQYTPNKPYCNFVGWYTSPVGDDNDVPVNLSTLIVQDNLTLYARFEEKNTMLVSAEGANRPAMAAVYAQDKFIEECEVMIYVDGAWRKAVVQT